MLKPRHHLPQIPKMQTVRNLFYRKELLNLTSTTRLLHNSRLLSPNPTEGCSSFYRFSYSCERAFHSGNRCSEEQSRVSSDSVDPDESPTVWTVYDPLTDQLVTRVNGFESQEVESSREEERFQAEVSAQKRAFRRVKKLEEDSSEGDDKPLAGQRLTRVEGSENLEVEVSKEGESFRAEKSVPKRPDWRVKKSEEYSSEGDEKSRVSSGSTSQAWSSLLKRRTGKVKVSWVCENCGATPGQWWGTCPTCQTMGTVKQFSEPEVSKARGVEVSEAAVRSWLPQREGRLVPQSLTDVNKGRNQSEWRIPLSGHFGMEVARVLGGGLVPGSLVLVGGDPGVGKSTLLLQIAAIIAQGLSFKGPAPVVYVSGEESIEQIGNRADRMGITTGNLFLYSSTDIEDILDKIQALSPQALIVDSIQTVYLRGVTGSAGNIMQVKECTSALLRFAKQTNIPVLLIGHVTKTGDIAGPRMLEHIVDAVLYMEGERFSSYRLLRSVKNRFGSTDELGVFEMSQTGLEAVLNPSEMFLSEHYFDSEVLAGLAIAVVVDGSRTFLIEIQALCVSGSSVSRHVNGVQESRAGMIISVLMKQAGLKLQENAIFLNVVSGLKLTETAGDLAIAAAICSSFLEFPLPNDVAFIGEIGLGGELRAVPRMDKRVMAVAKLGYKRCVIPKASEKLLAPLNLEITILSCRTLKEVIHTIFQARGGSQI